MERFTKAAVLDNDVEAGLLEAVLAEQGIPHIIRSYYDAAYDGVFQLQKGWGCVQAPKMYKADIIEILSDLRKQAATDDDSLS